MNWWHTDHFHICGRNVGDTLVGEHWSRLIKYIGFDNCMRYIYIYIYIYIYSGRSYIACIYIYIYSWDCSISRESYSLEAKCTKLSKYRIFILSKMNNVSEQKTFFQKNLALNRHIILRTLALVKDVSKLTYK